MIISILSVFIVVLLITVFRLSTRIVHSEQTIDDKDAVIARQNEAIQQAVTVINNLKADHELMRRQCIRVNDESLKPLQDAQWYSHELMRIKSGGRPDQSLPRRNVMTLEQYEKVFKEFKSTIFK